MGLIRGSLIFILTIILFLSLFVGNIFLTLNWSLEYDNVKPHLQNLTKETFQTTEIDSLLGNQYLEMQTICLTYDSYDFIYEKEIIKIPCEEILSGPEAILEDQIEKILEEKYFQKYDCELMDCVKQDPLVLISEKSKDYWKSKFYTTLIISIILFLLLFLLAKDKHTPFLITGIILVVTALPFKKMNLITNLFSEILPFDVFGVFFSKAENVFLIMAIIGIAIGILGFAIGFFKWGSKINGFLNKIIKRKNQEEKEKNEITKEEVKSIIKKEI